MNIHSYRSFFSGSVLSAFLVSATVLPFSASATTIRIPDLHAVKASVEKNISKTKSSKNVNRTCMQTAVTKRENAIVTAFDTYNTNVSTALKARRDALSAAWALTNATDRKAALKTAWKAFKGTWRTNNNSLKSARVAAWKQFTIDRKACRSTETTDEMEGANTGAQV